MARSFKMLLKRQFFVTILGCHIALAQAPMPPQPDQYPPLVGTHSDDLAVARSQFKTKLLRLGPPPTEWHELNPPSGAKQVHYRSGLLSLAAWISTPDDVAGKQYSAVLFLHSGFDLELTTGS